MSLYDSNEESFTIEIMRESCEFIGLPCELKKIIYVFKSPNLETLSNAYVNINGFV